MHEPGHEHDSQTIEFPRETAGLPEAGKTELVELADGDEFELEIIPVKKQIGDATVRMLAYNGSIPGPTLKVPQGATITVHVTNHGDVDATVHWHGLRLENRYDGTHDTQAPIPVGERFTYQVHVPDAGAFNVTLPGARLQLVGADAGHYEREELVDEVLLAPSERVVVDVLFPDASELELQHKTPEHIYRLASITIVDEPPEQLLVDEF